MTRRLHAAGLWALLFPASTGPSVSRSKDAVRQLDCVPLDPHRAPHTHPGTIEPPPPRGSFGEHPVELCAERWLRRDLRAPQSEALLSQLDARVRRLAAQATAERPELARRTWLVEAHHGDAQVAHKLRFATQTALVEQGRAVSDRVPLWSPQDVDVLTRLRPERAHAAACSRLAHSSQFREDDVLMSVLVLGSRETQLHAGLCVDGRWTWLQ